MDTQRYYAIAEATHVWQNPTTREKLEQVLDLCNLLNGHRVLDIGCGKAWLLREAARRYGIRGVGVEINPAFAKEAREALDADSLTDRIQILNQPARCLDDSLRDFDAVFCLGASFAIGTFREAISWIARHVLPGGAVAIGDLFAKRLPFPTEWQADYGDAQRTLSQTVDLLEGAGLRLVGLVASNDDDWDRYESLHWRNVHDWMSSHPEDLDIREYCDRSRRVYLEWERKNLGWGVFVCRASISSEM